MRAHIYDELIKLEADHWWFVARRKILRAVMETYLSNRPVYILDAGCGTGGNLDLLKIFGGQVRAMEMNRHAAVIAAQKSGAEVYIGSLPDNIPFPEEYFDLILLLDVLEHVECDEEALAALSSRLRPGGFMVITVPAFSFLWGYHDEVHQHKRRYRASELAVKVKKNGLEVTYCSYFNFFLFPAIALVRVLGKLLSLKPRNGDLYRPAPFLNGLLQSVMSSEGKLMRKISLPVGVSVMAVARKNRD